MEISWTSGLEVVLVSTVGQPSVSP